VVPAEPKYEQDRGHEWRWCVCAPEIVVCEFVELGVRASDMSVARQGLSSQSLFAAAARVRSAEMLSRQKLGFSRSMCRVQDVES
jgi:hypothetical protein